MIKANGPNSIIVALAAVCVLLFLDNKSLRTRYDNAFCAKKVEAQEFREFRNKHDKVVYAQAAIISKDAALVEQLSDSVFALQKKDERKVRRHRSFIKIAQSVELTAKSVPYDDTTSYALNDSLCDSLIAAQARMIIPPKHFDYRDSSLRISGQVLLHGISIDTFILTNDIALRVVSIKQGWFSPKVTTVQAINTNEAVRITGMQSVIIKEKPNAWNRWMKPLLFGTAGAAGMYYILK